MLTFFRRHQKILFIFVTVIIVFTMTFFGTSGFRGPNKGENPVVFKALDGRALTRHQMGQMIRFLSSDERDKLQTGGMRGPNFLNDGVIRSDLLESGLGAMLAAEYHDWLEPDLKMRREREKSFQPYVHARAGFLSAENIWKAYVPSLYSAYQSVHEGRSDPPAFQDRIALYLQESAFPQLALKHILRQQERQYSWIPPDPYLYNQDLSLFGYHTLEDWFGPRFLALASEFILNASVIAEQQGYCVTGAEAWAELSRNAGLSFQANQRSPHVDVARPQDYLHQQLELMGMDRAAATDVWRRVMLFRRLFQNVGDSALVDLFSLQKFHEYAEQSVDLEVYALSDDLVLPNYAALQAFECYLDAVAIRDESDPLALPTQFHTVDAVKQAAPELVQRRYRLEIAQTNQSSIAMRISLRELWDWELAPEQWERAQDRFPVLKSAPRETREERFAAIDQLDRHTRRQLDDWARSQMVQAHPEWVEETLEVAEVTEMTVGIPLGGSVMPLEGIQDREALLALLDSPSEILQNYSQDGKSFYRIEVLDCVSKDEILTFAEAFGSGSLATTVQRQLGEPGRARDERADQKYADLLRAAYYEALPHEPFESELPDAPTGAYAATHRFRSHLARIRDDVMEHGEASDWVLASEPVSLADQWKVLKQPVALQRQEEQRYGLGEPYGMASGSWSTVIEETRQPGYFFKVCDTAPGHLVAHDQLDQGQRALAADAKRCYMRELLNAMKSEESLSLAALFPQESS